MLPPSTIKDAAVFIYGHPRSRTVLLSLLGSLMLSKVLCQCWRYYSNKNKLKSKQAELSKKRAVVEAQLLNKDVQFYEEILSKTAPELVEALKNGDMCAVDVLRAYQCKALELTDSINCVAEFITEAEENAKALDALPDKKGLLYGVPVSIKENINIAGYESTGGVECLIGSVAKEDAVIVKLLRKHGAIPFARTNLPQTMLSYSCTNYIYGETTNPQDKTRSPGGSSGGEAAMLGGGGSVIGVGTDLGGSVRIPADFCGVYSLKLTRGRIQGKGVLTFTKGNLGILGVLGPMARDFDSLLLLSQALLSPEMIDLDRSLPNLPFDPQVYEKKTPLRIGYYTFDGMLQCQPPVVRAVMEAKAALESMGHQLVPFDFPAKLGGGFQSGELFLHILMAERGEVLRNLLKNQKVTPSLKLFLTLGGLPVWFVKTLQFIVGLKDQFSASTIGGTSGFKSLADYFQHITKLTIWQEDFMKVWVDEKLDAVICPVYPSPAVSRDKVHQVTPCGIYCQLYNALNYPAGVIPVTKVTQDDVNKTFDPKFFTPKCYMEKILQKSSKDSVGLSVGVQCVALPYQEEICLRVMRDVNKGLQGKK